MKRSYIPVQVHFPSLHSETIGPISAVSALINFIRIAEHIMVSWKMQFRLVLRKSGVETGRGVANCNAVIWTVSIKLRFR